MKDWILNIKALIGLALAVPVAVGATVYTAKNVDLPFGTKEAKTQMQTLAGIPAEAVRVFKELAGKANNKHWKDQEERLNKSAYQIESDTNQWMEHLKKINIKVTEDALNERSAEMKDWEDKQFSNDFFKDSDK